MEAHARDELGIDIDDAPSPVQASAFLDALLALANQDALQSRCGPCSVAQQPTGENAVPVGAAKDRSPQRSGVTCICVLIADAPVIGAGFDSIVGGFLHRRHNPPAGRHLHHRLAHPPRRCLGAPDQACTASCCSALLASVHLLRTVRAHLVLPLLLLLYKPCMYATGLLTLVCCARQALAVVALLVFGAVGAWLGARPLSLHWNACTLYLWKRHPAPGRDD